MILSRIIDCVFALVYTFVGAWFLSDAIDRLFFLGAVGIDISYKESFVR